MHGLTFIMYIEYVQVILRDARSLLAPPPAASTPGAVDVVSVSVASAALASSSIPMDEDNDSVGRRLSESGRRSVTDDDDAAALRLAAGHSDLTLPRTIVGFKNHKVDVSWGLVHIVYHLPHE